MTHSPDMLIFDEEIWAFAWLIDEATSLRIPLFKIAPENGVSGKYSLTCNL
jgi:hypothetical protein